jgi:hypothetical protein
VPSWLARQGEHVPSPRSAEGDTARIAALASAAGTPVEAVLREVADFRLALETDLIIAAAAVDADEFGLAAEVVDGERAGLVAFHERMLERLVDVAAADSRDELAARRARRADRLSARARIVTAAAALVAVVSGGAALAPSAGPERNPSTEQVALDLADAQLSTLTGTIIRDASSADITDAAGDLHETLETLIAEHAAGDPVMAMKIAALIREEQRLLNVDRSPATVSALKDVARLVAQLKRKAPPTVVATLVPVAPPEDKKASPKPSKSSSPKASPKPKPSASPKPSPSSSPTEDDQPGPLPTGAP